MNVGVVIPAYNVGSKLDAVLSKVGRYVEQDGIVVVDDGSLTPIVLPDLFSQAHLLRHEDNLGKGAALKTGFDVALKLGFDAVITLDGDGQHDADCIPQFIETALTSEADLVLGSRSFKLGVMPPDRIFSNRVSTALVSWLAGVSIRDSQCGFRLISRKVLECVTLETSHYETETELLVKAARKGHAVAFCPVPVIYDGTPSNIQRGTDTWRFCRLYWDLMRNGK